MRISRIEIANHSRIRDLVLEVRGHAVIVGANDVGKSSVLRLLNRLFTDEGVEVVGASLPG